MTSVGSLIAASPLSPLTFFFQGVFREPGIDALRLRSRGAVSPPVFLSIALTCSSLAHASRFVFAICGTSIFAVSRCSA